MLDKDDKRVLASDSWHAYVRDLYSNPGGFRRRRVLLQVKQNQLTLVGFEPDVQAMRKQIYDYFVENAISFYESDWTRRKKKHAFFLFSLSLSLTCLNIFYFA